MNTHEIKKYMYTEGEIAEYDCQNPADSLKVKQIIRLAIYMSPKNSESSCI